MRKITFLLFVLSFTFGFAQTPEGTWRMNPAAGAFGVGPGQGDTSWFANTLGDVTTRACFFDDDFVFEAGGTFSNVQGSDTWVEGWQDGNADGCRAGVTPHNGSNAATWAYDSGAGTLTLTGVGAHVGIAKAVNGSELSTPGDAPASVTYTVTAITENSMTLDINVGAGWWRFVLQKQGVAPTCDDGIMNGDETGIDCGGSCPPCLAQIDLPVDFEGSTTDYTVTDFGGNTSTLVTDPTDSGNMVIQSIKGGGAQGWAGTTIGNDSGGFVATDGFASNIPLTLADTKMNIRVWSPDAGIPIRLKVEDATDNTHTCETETLTTVSGAWETLEFDFSNEAPGTESLAVGLGNGWVYSKASIFFNFGTDGATAGEKTYYFDDVKFGAKVLSTENFDLGAFSALPNPTQNTWTVKSAKNNILSVSLYDVLGKSVLTMTTNAKEVRIDATSLKVGLYFATIKTLNGVKSIKLIKN